MSEKTAEKRVGRPSVDSEAVNVRCERNLLNALDAWRLSRPSEYSRPMATRHLMRQALATFGYGFEGKEEMTSAERELLLLLAHEVAQDIARNLREAGLRENEGVGGASIRKIILLTETIRAEASAD